MSSLQDRTMIISGASRGIGEAIAKLLAQQGAHVIVSSRKIDDCQKVADAIVAVSEGPRACGSDLNAVRAMEAMYQPPTASVGNLAT